MTDLGMGSIFKARNAESRSITAENPTGEKGKGGLATFETTLHPPSANAARELGLGWKLSPCVLVKSGETFVVMDNDGPGIIRHMWFTMAWQFHRDLILRIYWDGDEFPSVESPMGDFFCTETLSTLRIRQIEAFQA